jgi:hypothetical protein
MMNKKELQDKLIEKASDLCEELYACGLDRLDSDELQYYMDNVTEEEFDFWVNDLAGAAWFSY